MNIKIIFFDLDDTLWECYPVIKHAESCFYDWLSSHYAEITQTYDLDQLNQSRKQYMQQYPEWQHDLTYLRKQWLRTLAQAFSIADIDHFVEKSFMQFWLPRNEVTFFEGTLKVLEQLKTHFSLGVISNGNADVRHIGIDHLFTTIVSSIEAGAAKPAPGIFHYALDKANVQSHEAMYVGDDPVRDVVGAMNVGIKAVWFNPLMAGWPHELTVDDKMPDLVINNLQELPAKLSDL